VILLSGGHCILSSYFIAKFRVFESYLFSYLKGKMFHGGQKKSHVLFECRATAYSLIFAIEKAPFYNQP